MPRRVHFTVGRRLAALVAVQVATALVLLVVAFVAYGRLASDFGFMRRYVIAPIDGISGAMENAAQLKLAAEAASRAGREPDIATGGDEAADATQRYVQSDFIDHVGHVALEQRDLDLVAVAAQIELLAQPDGTQRIDGRAIRLAAAQKRETGAAPPDFNKERPCPLERGVFAERIPQCQE